MTDHADIGSCFSESSVVLRTSDAYEYHLAAVSESAANANVYGVNRPCVFASLPGFDVLRAFPPDIMHDVLEGVIPLTLKLVMRNIIDTCKCTVSDINKSLNSVKLTHPENRPCQLSESITRTDAHIAGSAIQKLELFLLFARLIGTSVPEGDKVWQVYLNLRTVCDLILAPIIEKDDVVLLQHLIATYLSSFVEVFGAESVIPKMHYMVHYPRFISLLGPMRNYWCMRFEAKHQYFKRIAASTKCFKNITKTLAKRHQMRQSREMSGSEVLLSHDRVLSKSKHMKFAKLPEAVKESVSASTGEDFADLEDITVVTHLAVDNIMYKADGVYVLGTVAEEVVPLFVNIKHILSVRDSWILCGRLLTPCFFSSHFHAYLVTEEESFILFRPGQLADHSAHDSFLVNGCQYVSVRYCIAEH